MKTPKTSLTEKEGLAKAEEVLKLIGLGRECNNSVAALSIVQRRMLQLGVAVISRPKVLLLDEPCVGLDPVNLERMVELICRFRKELG